ncbi:MAG: hypothetical protein QOE58_3633 [Actinomycetota bacterium]|nr:hypothetical protein [Actinomycetota bacterium]
MAAVVVVTYAAIVWTLRRGFDWTDEAFVYDLVASNRISVEVPLGFQHLLHPLYQLTGESVLAFRTLRLGGYLLLSVALVWCARAVLRRIGISLPQSGWLFILLLAQIGTFLAWSYPPRYLGYNELGAWFVQLGVGLLLLSLGWGLSPPTDPVSEVSSGSEVDSSSEVDSGSEVDSSSEMGAPRLSASKVLSSVWAGLGVVTTLLLFAKVTSALAFGAMVAIVIVVANPHLTLRKRAVSLGVGTAAALLTLWLLGAPIGPYFRDALALLFDKSAQDAAGHPFSEMVSVYSDSVSSTGRAVLPAVLLFALAMATLHGRVRRLRDAGRGSEVDGIAWTLGALLLISWILLPRDPVWAYLGNLIAFIGIAGIIGLVVLGAGGASAGGASADGATLHGSSARRIISVALAGALIVATPFMSAVGTNNAIVQQFVWAATLWAVVLGVALVLLSERASSLSSSASSLPQLVGCLVMVLASLAVKADIEHPYRNPPLESQQTSTSVPELRGLLLSEPDAAWASWLFSAGDSLRAFNVPATAIGSAGALYAFNHSGYASPWVGRGNNPAALKSLSLACMPHPPPDLFVLQPGSATARSRPTAGVTKSLAVCGISFPSNFRVVAKRDSADPALAMTIWRLNPPAARH